MPLLTDISKKLRELISQGSQFVQQNPSPSRYVAQQLQQRVAQPVQRFVQQYPSPATLPMPSQITRTPSGQQTPMNVGQYFTGLTPPRTIQQLPRFAAQAGTQAMNTMGSAFMGNPNLMGAQALVKPTLQSLGSAFGIGAGSSAVQQYGETGKVNPMETLKSGITMLPFGALTAVERPQINKAVQELRGKLTTEDIGIIGKFAELVETKKDKGKLGELGQTIHSLATNVFGKEAETWSNQKIKNSFDLVLGKIGQGPNTAGLGLTTKPIREVPKTVKMVGDSNINVKNLKLTSEETKTLESSIKSIQPELEKIKGKTLSNQEVVQAAKKAKVLSQVVTRADTMTAEAQILKARQNMVALDKEISAMQKSGNTEGVRAKMSELINAIKVVSGTAADTGRKLQSFNIMAEDQSVRNQILQEILKSGADTDKVIQEAGKVNWNKSGEVARFYREFIKPSFTDLLTEYRYNNMLSNPRTHLRNAFSNVIQTFVTRPATLAFQGDVKGAAQYYKGSLSSFPKAVDAFVTSMKGEAMPSAKYDIAKMPSGKMPRIGTLPTRAMEAADKFFQALIVGGEKARGQTAEQGVKTAEYSLFRGGLYPEGQGALLKKIDNMTLGLYQMRKNFPFGDWFVPFLRTTMNVAKQWVEYSPLGLGTIPGSEKPKEQLAKALIGSIVTTVGAKMALEGNTTWASPTDPKQKQYFYDTGRKPYSILINGKWIPMATLGIYAFPFAAPAAAKYFNEESRTALTDSDAEKALNVVTSMLGYWSTQTPMAGLGGLVKTMQGDIDYSIAKNLGFTASQLIPFQGLVRYLTTALDPVYRKTSGFVEQIQSTLPLVSKKLEPYTNSSGEVSKRNITDYVAPYSAGVSNPEFEDLYNMRTEKLQMNNVKNQMKKDLEKQVNTGVFDQVQAAETPQSPVQSFVEKERAKMKEELAKEKFKMSSAPVQTFGTQVWIKDGDAIKTIDTSFQPTPPQFSGMEELDSKARSEFNSDITKKANDIYALYKAGQMSMEEANNQMAALQNLKNQYAASKKAKKPKKPAKVTSRKISPGKVTIKSLTRGRIPTVKIRKFRSKKLAAKNIKLGFAKQSKTYKITQPPKIKGLTAGVKLV